MKDTIIATNIDGTHIRLSECHDLYQAYWSGPESMGALGCPLAVYITDGIVVYPDGTTEEP